MRIAISGYFLLHPNTGTGQYTASLIRTLASDLPDDLLVVCPRPVARLARSLLEGRTAPWRVVPVSVPTRGDLGKLWFEQVALPTACRRIGAELLHVPYFGPPLWKPCKTVVTVHDLIMLLFPETRRSPQARLYTRLAVRGTRRADLVLADSISTRDDIIRKLRLGPEKLTVAYLAHDEALRPASDEQVQEVLSRYELPTDYLFYIGGLDWRKNLPRLLRVLASLPEAPVLAIAGKAFSDRRDSFPDLEGMVRSLGIQDRVDFLGPVPEEDKAPLYSGCTAFIFPSLYEGFGLTPLEAMACGAPVVCSRASSLPEVVGEAAVLFDPLDEASLSAAIVRVLADSGLRQVLAAKGLDQARKFNWRRTAAQTIEAYRLAISGGSTSKLWGIEQLPHWNTALRRARGAVRQREGRLLEIGCGAGRFIRSLMLANPKARFFGCDLDVKSLAAGQQNKGPIHFVAADIHALPYPSRPFETVVVFDVLEHLRRPEEALAEISRVLEQGGLMHALVPCEGQPWSLHWLLWKLRLGADLKERHCGHVQRFTRRSVVALLEGSGFQILRMTYSMHPMGQLRDILRYVAQEEWSRRHPLGGRLCAALARVLWPVAYVESNLLFKGLAAGAVEVHVTARKVARPA